MKTQSLAVHGILSLPRTVTISAGCKAIQKGHLNDLVGYRSPDRCLHTRNDGVDPSPTTLFQGVMYVER
jgi:hypothetical protein